MSDKPFPSESRIVESQSNEAKKIETSRHLTKEEVAELFEKTADSYHRLVIGALPPFNFKDADKISVDYKPPYTDEQINNATAGFKQWLTTDYEELSKILRFAKMQSAGSEANAELALEVLSEKNKIDIRPDWWTPTPEIENEEKRKADILAAKEEEVTQAFGLSPEDKDLYLGKDDPDQHNLPSNPLDQDRREKLFEARKEYFETTSIKPRFDPETAELLRDYNEELGHDLRAVFGEFKTAFAEIEMMRDIEKRIQNGEDIPRPERKTEYVLNDFTFQYVEDLIRGVGRQIADKPLEIDFDPKDALNKLQGLFMTLTAQNRAAEKNDKNKVDFKLNFEVDEGILLHGDPGYFQQIFYNWINNSRQIHIENFTKKGITNYSPVINVAVKRLEGTGYVRPYVKDNAGGFPTKMINTVYDRGITERHGGTGIGLAIVRNLAEKHFKGKVGAGNYMYKESPDNIKTGAHVWLTMPEADTIPGTIEKKKAA